MANADKFPSQGSRVVQACGRLTYTSVASCLGGWVGGGRGGREGGKGGGGGGAEE